MVQQFFCGKFKKKYKRKINEINLMSMKKMFNNTLGKKFPYNYFYTSFTFIYNTQIKVNKYKKMIEFSKMENFL